MTTDHESPTVLIYEIERNNSGTRVYPPATVEAATSQ